MKSVLIDDYVLVSVRLQISKTTRLITLPNFISAESIAILRRFQTHFIDVHDKELTARGPSRPTYRIRWSRRAKSDIEDCLVEGRAECIAKRHVQWSVEMGLAIGVTAAVGAGVAVTLKERMKHTSAPVTQLMNLNQGKLYIHNARDPSYAQQMLRLRDMRAVDRDTQSQGRIDWFQTRCHTLRSHRGANRW